MKNELEIYSTGKANFGKQKARTFQIIKENKQVMGEGDYLELLEEIDKMKKQLKKKEQKSFKYAVKALTPFGVKTLKSIDEMNESLEDYHNYWNGRAYDKVKNIYTDFYKFWLQVQYTS